MNDTQHDRFATVLSPTEIRFKHSDLSLNKAPPPERYKEMDRTGRQAMLQITEIDRPRHLAFTWGDGSEVVFDLAPQGDKVLLTLTHRRIAKGPTWSAPRAAGIAIWRSWSTRPGPRAAGLLGCVPEV